MEVVPAAVSQKPRLMRGRLLTQRGQHLRQCTRSPPRRFAWTYGRPDFWSVVLQILKSKGRRAVQVHHAAAKIPSVTREAPGRDAE